LASPEVVSNANWVTALVVGVSTPLIAGLGAIFGRYVSGRSKVHGDVLVSWSELTKTLRSREEEFQTRADLLQARIDTLTIAVSKCESDRMADQRHTLEIELELGRCQAATERWEEYTIDLERELRKHLPRDASLPKFSKPGGDDECD
jgi:hypothetical protein